MDKLKIMQSFKTFTPKEINEAKKLVLLFVDKVDKNEDTEEIVNELKKMEVLNANGDFNLLENCPDLDSWIDELLFQVV